MQHTRVLLPLIKAAFAKTDHTLQDCAGVAVSNGPGSYTALRAGLSSAKGICLALDVPLLQVSTLRALATVALGARAPEAPPVREVLSVLVARRRQLYAARYGPDGEVSQAPHTLEADEAWAERLRGEGGVLVVGPEAQGVAERFDEFVEHANVTLEARNLLTLSAFMYREGAFAELGAAVPLYLKPPHITVAKPKF